MVLDHGGNKPLTLGGGYLSLSALGLKQQGLAIGG